MQNFCLGWLTCTFSGTIFGKALKQISNLYNIEPAFFFGKYQQAVKTTQGTGVATLANGF